MSAAGFNISYQQKLVQLRHSLEKEISLLCPQLLRVHPPESYAQELRRWENQHGYHFVPPEVYRTCKQIVARVGIRGLELYHKVLLLSLIEGYEQSQRHHRIPDSVRQLIPVEFDRILTGMAYAEEGCYLHKNDLFAKDLALCRLKLVPCGSEVVDLWSGIPRSTLLRGGVSQLIGGTRLRHRLGGFKPLYETHWDRRLVRRFTAREYDLCYFRVAELLRLNTNIKGMFGSSWWFDPQLEEIAPEWRFLRRTPTENGATILRLGPDAGAIRDAIQFSKKRKALFESGKFKPRRHMVVWTRADMLDWADRFAVTEEHSSQPQLSQHY